MEWLTQELGAALEVPGGDGTNPWAPSVTGRAQGWLPCISVPSLSCCAVQQESHIWFSSHSWCKFCYCKAAQADAPFFLSAVSWVSQAENLNSASTSNFPVLHFAYNHLWSAGRKLAWLVQVLLLSEITRLLSQSKWEDCPWPLLCSWIDFIQLSIDFLPHLRNGICFVIAPGIQTTCRGLSIPQSRSDLVCTQPGESHQSVQFELAAGPGVGLSLWTGQW